jgi:hypothetical protein
MLVMYAAPSWSIDHRREGPGGRTLGCGDQPAAEVGAAGSARRWYVRRRSQNLDSELRV